MHDEHDGTPSTKQILQSEQRMKAAKWVRMGSLGALLIALILVLVVLFRFMGVAPAGAGSIKILLGLIAALLLLAIGLVVGPGGGLFRRTLGSLARERAFNRHMLDSVGMVSWEADPATLQFTYVSPLAERLLGFAREDWLVAGYVESQIHDRDRAQVVERLRYLVSHGIDGELEFRVRHRDGTTRWLRSVVMMQHDTRRRVVGIRGVLVDFTESRKTRKRLEESEHRFRKMANQAPTLIWLAEQDGNLQFVNDAWLQFTGVPDREALGKGWQSLVHPDDLERLLNAWQDSIRDRKPYDIRYLLKHRDSGYRWVYERGMALISGADEQIEFIGSAVDIDDMVKAESALRESQQRMRFHIERTPLAYIEVDIHRRIVAWNDSAARIFGYESSQAIGRDIVSLIVPGAVRGHVNPLIDQLLKEGRSNQSRNENIRADGKTIVCEWYNTPLVDSNDRVTGFASMADDITERVHAEQRIRESESRYRLLAENAADMISRHTISGRNTYVSPASSSMLGRDPADLMEMQPCDLVHPDDVAKVRDYHSKVLEGTAPPSLRFRLQHNDGRYRCVEMRPQLVPSEPLDNGESRDAEIVCITRDITPQVIAEEALRRSQSELRTITDALPVVIGRLDRDYRFTFVNAEGLKLYSRPIDRLLGVHLAETIPEHRYVYHEPYLKRAMSGVPVRYEYVNAVKGEPARFMDVMVIPDQRGNEIEGAFFLVTDVTEQRRAASQIERDARLKGLLLSELNHRLKNALASLITLIDLCRENYQSVEGFANAISRRVKAMTDVHSLLSARQYAPLELEMIVLTMVPPESPGRISIAGPPTMISASQASPLGFVIQELMSNSLKYGALASPDGKLSVAWGVVHEDPCAEPADFAAWDLSQPQQEAHKGGQAFVIIDWEERGFTMDLERVSPGLGTGLIHGFAKHELRGEMLFNYQVDGVKHRLIFRPTRDEISDPASSSINFTEQSQDAPI